MINTYNKQYKLVEMLETRPLLNELRTKFMGSIYLKDLDLNIIYDAYKPLVDPRLSLKDLFRLEKLSPKVFQQVQMLATKF